MSGMRKASDEHELAGPRAEIDPGSRSNAARFASWAGVSTAVLAVASMVTGVTTPPRSGPYCEAGCVAYPYTAAAEFVPRDYLWMYPTLLMVLAFVTLAGGLHDLVPGARRVFSRAGLSLSLMGASLLVVDYALQLTVMQPALLTGELEGVSPLSQYNPHGVFIGVENVGYALLAGAFAFLGVALATSRSTLLRVAAWVLRLGAVLTLLDLIVSAVVYRSGLDYRFEVIALLVTWLVLVATGVLVPVALRRDARWTPPRCRTNERNHLAQPGSSTRRRAKPGLSSVAPPTEPSYHSACPHRTRFNSGAHPSRDV